MIKVNLINLHEIFTFSLAKVAFPLIRFELDSVEILSAKYKQSYTVYGEIDDTIMVVKVLLEFYPHLSRLLPRLIVKI